MMTLASLQENETGTIYQIEDEKLALQLLTMGFILGEEIKVERIAPLKDPILITSGTNYISIRKEDAEKINILKKN
jgi:ferrous iron transport protein A